MNNISNNNQSSFHKKQNLELSQTIPHHSLEDLNMMNSFLLDATTENPKDAEKIAKVIIKRTTGHDVKNLIVEIQKQLKGVSLGERGIRMDIYARELDEDGFSTIHIYDIEPNNYYEKDITHRSRFYQSLIDSKLLPTSTPFEKMPEVTTIWILPYDPFGDDRMLYTVKNVVVENNRLVYNDGITKIFLYTKGTKGGSKELKDLLLYMENTTFSNAVDEDLMEIQEIVTRIKNNPETKERFMTLQEMINYEKRDSYEDGRAQGIIEGIQGIIALCKTQNLGKNLAQDTIMNQYSLTESQADEYLNLYW